MTKRRWNLGFAGVLVFSSAMAAGLQSGDPVFSDFDACRFADVPAFLEGKQHLISSYYSASIVTFNQSGFGYVITAEDSLLCTDLENSGYKDVPFFYSPTLWTDLPKGYRLKLFEKAVQPGEILSLGSWGIVVFSEEPIVSEESSQPSCAAMIPVSREDLPWWKGRHQKKLEEIKSGQKFDWVFLGDSITQRWETESGGVYDNLLSQRHILNLGYCGDQTQNVLWRLANGELDGVHSRLVVLLIGTNNLPPDRSTPEEAVRGIRDIICTLREKLPAAALVIHAVFPRGQYPDDPYRKAVSETNQGIMELVREYHLLYLDVGTVFLDPETGMIKPELMPDFLHPSAEGYALWADILMNNLIGL